MKCSKCGHQNTEESKFCAVCGSPLNDGQPSGWETSSSGTGKGKMEPCDIALMVLSLVYALLYAVKALRVIPGIYYSLRNALFYEYVPLVFQVQQFCNIAFILLTIVSCVIFAYVLILFAFRQSKGHMEQLYIGVAAAAVLRVVVALLQYLLFLVMYFFMGTFYRPWGLGKTFLYAAITAGSLLVILYVSKRTPFAGRSKEELLAMVKGLFAVLRDETVSLFGDAKNLGNEGKKRMENYASEHKAAQDARAAAGGAQGGFSGGGVSGGLVPQGGMPGNVSGGMPLQTDRNLVVVILLSIITCGIYALYFVYTMARDINIICEGDGEQTPGLLEYFLLSLVTCGIYAYFWDYKFEERLMRNGSRYGVMITESGGTVLMWKILGMVTCGVGLVMASYIQIKNINALSKAYNERNRL